MIEFEGYLIRDLQDIKVITSVMSELGFSDWYYYFYIDGKSYRVNKQLDNARQEAENSRRYLLKKINGTKAD